MSATGLLRYHLMVNGLGRAALRLQRWQSERRAVSPDWKTEYLAPPLEIAPRTKELVARHWLQGRYANLNRKVAWVTSGAPAELLKALGFYVLYPENHAAICGTARVAVDISTEAENAGYSRVQARNTRPSNLEAGLTSYDAKTFHILLTELEGVHGVTHLAMEASSHALDQERLTGLTFDAAGFTNLTQDHLDFHGSMAAYGEAKAKLFLEHAPGTAVICTDGDFGQAIFVGYPVRRHS